MNRVFAVIVFLIVVFLAVGAVFWQQELKYQLPTPEPVQYKPVAVGATIDRTLLPAGGAFFFISTIQHALAHASMHVTLIRSFASLVIVSPCILWCLTNKP